MKRHLLISEFMATPWAMMPERINAASAILQRWAAKAPRAMEDDDEGGGPRKSAWQMRREQAQAMATSTSIAVLPLYGTVVQRAGMMTEWCGGTSTQQFTSAFREVINDDAVGAVLIDIDSPGGSVYGVAELADEIYQARSAKPIVAIANSLAASAAYWIGCAAGEFYVMPGGEVGSIGVWQAHFDYSKSMEEEGIKPTLISAGRFKVEGNCYNPLDEEAKAFMQSRVDDYYRSFSQGVSRCRGVPLARVTGGMGQGRVLGGEAAVAENMVDGIATFDQVVQKLQANIRSSTPPPSARRSRLAAAQDEIARLG